MTSCPHNSYHSFTHLQSKSWYSDNFTNKQLANVLGYIAKLLNANQILNPNTNLRRTKVCISNTFSSTETNKLNNFLFQCCLTSTQICEI